MTFGKKLLNALKEAFASEAGMPVGTKWGVPVIDFGGKRPEGQKGDKKKSVLPDFEYNVPPPEKGQEYKLNDALPNFEFDVPPPEKGQSRIVQEKKDKPSGKERGTQIPDWEFMHKVPPPKPGA